jgi:uncharacterized RDD family membrane protein YckC
MTQDNPYAPPKSPTTPEPDLPADELASRRARLFAYMIDSVLVYIPWWIFVSSTGLWLRVTSGGMGAMDHFAMVLSAMLLYVILNGYHLNYYGQTLGKRVVGLRVVSLESNAILPLWKILAFRVLPVWVASAIPVLGSLASWVDYLFIFRGDKRCVHDFIANTKVVAANVPWKHANGELGAS